MRVQSDAESSQPRRPGLSPPNVQPSQPGATRERLRWRAVIHPGQKLDPSRGQQPVAWHLADCDDPTQVEAHCEVGRHLIATDGNPDGHCRIGGACPRCAETPAVVSAAD